MEIQKQRFHAHGMFSRIRSRFPAVMAALMLPLALAGCHHSSKTDITMLSVSSDKALWEAGQKAIEKQRWETARQYLNRLINGFPRSEYNPLARLALADSHFKEGGTTNFILAASEYREFQTIFPSHARADYAQYQVAKCYFNQLQRADRDQANTYRAVEEYQRLLDLYPSSTYVASAREELKTCRETLARSEFLVGLFYERTRRLCRSAILRYEYLLEQYPDYSDTDEVLFRLANCLVETGREAEARPRLNQLIESFPSSRHMSSARRLLSELPGNIAPPPKSDSTPEAEVSS